MSDLQSYYVTIEAGAPVMAGSEEEAKAVFIKHVLAHGLGLDNSDYQFVSLKVAPGPKPAPQNELRWVLASERRPDHDEVVDVITDSGSARKLRFWHNLWWLPDRSMYVYFNVHMWLEVVPMEE